MYKLADILEIKIHTTFGWSVNKAYETKEKLAKSVFISNRNNVKGLEFPFVICVTRGITNSSSYRNSLYTMLTRSLLQLHENSVGRKIAIVRFFLTLAIILKRSLLDKIFFERSIKICLVYVLKPILKN